ncbi:unnamed protein product [Mucor hiemalis]
MCIRSYWTGPSPQNKYPKSEDIEVATPESGEQEVSKSNKQFKNLLIEPLNTVARPIAAAYAPAPTPQGVIGQLIPYIVTALGGGEPYMKGHPGAYGQPYVNGQPYSQGQNGANGQAGANNQAGTNAQPYPNAQTYPNRYTQWSGQPKPTEQPQPNMDLPGQPDMNDQPNMNGQPNPNGQQPGVNAQPTMVVQPSNAPAVATDPSLLTTHTTVLSLVTPSSDPSFVPSNIFHLSQGVKVNPAVLWTIGFVLLFATHHLI